MIHESCHGSLCDPRANVLTKREEGRHHGGQVDMGVAEWDVLDMFEILCFSDATSCVFEMIFNIYLNNVKKTPATKGLKS